MRKNRMACILLWMAGGPSQLETFDPKPGTEHGGETKAIATAVPGISIAEGWNADGQGHEGHRPGAVHDQQGGQPPARDLSAPHRLRAVGDDQAPAHRLLGGRRAGREPLRPAASSSASAGRRSARASWARPWSRSWSRTPRSRPRTPSRRSPPTASAAGSACSTAWRTPASSASAASTASRIIARLYHQTARMILSPHMRAFSLDEEPEPIRAAYGHTPFGQGCLLARRLVQAGVTFVEVRSQRLGHPPAEPREGRQARRAGRPGLRRPDPRPEAQQACSRARWSSGWASSAARPRSTPTPAATTSPGSSTWRWPAAGVKGGQVIGASNPDGTDVKDRPVTVPDLLASICHSLKVDPTRKR